jgi:hypothetical protein
VALTKITGQVINDTTGLVVGVTTVGGGISATDGFFSGIVTASGNLTVGGVLTYEDVTNVDSVGLITARNGIVVGSGITLSKDGDIFATGITTISENLKVGTGVTISPDGDGFFTGVVTATSYRGDGSNLTGVSADVVDDTSPQLGGNLDTNTRNIQFGDSAASTDDRLTFGAGTDLSIYHNGTDNYIDTVANKLRIRVDNSDDAVVANTNGSVELYYSNSKKAETVTGGFKVTGALALAASSGNNPTIDNADGGNGNNLYFKTGGTLRLVVESDGHTRPGSNNSYDLGTSTDRWRNVYTNDLNLSNKGSTNSVDNTWGDYTIQEGESDLFLINNRSGKKYKFNLTEVS